MARNKIRLDGLEETHHPLRSDLYSHARGWISRVHSRPRGWYGLRWRKGELGKYKFCFAFPTVLTPGNQDVSHSLLCGISGSAWLPEELRPFPRTFAAHRRCSATVVSLDSAILSISSNEPNGRVNSIIGLAVMVGSSNNILRYVFLHICIGGAFAPGTTIAAWLADNTPDASIRVVLFGLLGLTPVSSVSE